MNWWTFLAGWCFSYAMSDLPIMSSGHPLWHSAWSGVIGLFCMAMSTVERIEDEQ